MRWGSYCSPSVTIDLHPNESPNQVNLRGSQLVPVAILGKEGWNPCDDTKGADKDSVKAFNAICVHSSCKDVNKDGFTDMLLHFRANELLQEPVDCNGLDATFELTGETIDNVPFEGYDSVTWLGCK